MNPTEFSPSGLDKIRLQEGRVVCSDTATCTRLQEDTSVYRCNRAPVVEQHSCCINACSSDEISRGYLCTYYDTGSCMTNGYGHLILPSAPTRVGVPAPLQSRQQRPSFPQMLKGRCSVLMTGSQPVRLPMFSARTSSTALWTTASMMGAEARLALCLRFRMVRAQHTCCLAATSADSPMTLLLSQARHCQQTMIRAALATVSS